MSIMRTFTTRRKPDLDTPSFVGRAASQRGGRPVARAQISAPVELVSTTNMLSYNAPNIAGTKPIEHRDFNSGSSSSEESDGNNSVHSQETDPTDLSSADASPISTGPNHLSHFFKASTDDTSSADSSPTLPRRAPSHSKRAHEALSRQRSVQRARSPSAQGRGLSHTRSSAAMFASQPEFLEPPQNPFGKELAQLDAVAEEFGGVRTEAEVDAMWIQTRNLGRYGATEYLSEIEGLVAVFLRDQSPTGPDFSGWF